jgi:hypothetical protein
MTRAMFVRDFVAFTAFITVLMAIWVALPA